MRVFQQVVDEGGFAAAARRLDLSPAVVTRLVGDLEGALGVRLLNRTTRRLSLTQAGEAYLQRVRLILRDIDEAEAVAQAESRAISGTLRLCAMPVVATHLLAPAVAQFQQMHPGVVVDINVSASPESTMEEFDLTVLADAGMLAADLVVRPIVDTQRVLCASPEYLRREGTPREPADLAQHRWLDLSRPGARPGHLPLVGRSQADRQSRMLDIKDRLPLLRRIEKRALVDQAYQFPVLWWQRIVPHSGRLKGWKIGPSHYVNQDLRDVWLAQ